LGVPPQMSYCPRCVRPVPPDATQCPSCRYDLPVAARFDPDVELESSRARGAGAAAAPSEHAWGVGIAVVACFAVLAVIAVLVSHLIGHHGLADTKRAAPAAITPTRAVGQPSSPSSPTQPTSASPSSSSSARPSASRSERAPSSARRNRRAANRRQAITQASTISRYLSLSGRARHRISPAINAISGCRHIRWAVATLRYAAEVRARIAAFLPRTDVSALRRGTVARAYLGRAMRISASADRHYAAWGKAMAGCHRHARRTHQFAAAQRADGAADVAKRRFVYEWNRIAATYRLPRRNANTI
jgi:hypothetical protein